MRRQVGTMALAILAGCAAVPIGADALPSWNSSDARDAIVTFVEKVTIPGADYVPPAERIAVFDNDGTLWSEKPLYFQLFFALDRIRALAPEHPEWREKQPFRAVLENDMEALLASGKRGLVELVLASHTGNTTAEFRSIVEEWLAEARHPRFDRPFTELVYQPMLELLDYLRQNGFKTSWCPKTWSTRNGSVLPGIAATNRSTIRSCQPM